MKYFKNFLILLGMMGGGCATAALVDGTSLSYGIGVNNLKPLRIGLQSLWDLAWCEKHLCKVKGYWEFSAYYMHTKKIAEIRNNKLLAVAFTPVFRLDTNPYVELAFGLSQVNKREIGKRKLGVNFQFEDRLGVGFKFGKQKQLDCGYRAIHFSNAYIGKKNHGINLHTLYLSYWF